jgi:hypothetical protein
MCVTKVWGFLGGKPWFYTFWGSGACFGGGVHLVPQNNQSEKKPEKETNHNPKIHTIILYIYLYRGGLL